jgi:hypothetical protein
MNFSPTYELLRKRAEDSNLDPKTLLATDYLNHFNEIVMLLEMVPDMPDMLEDVKAWKPKSYKDHFRDSTIAHKDLAIEAYDHVPAIYREPFEQTVAQIDATIASAIWRIEADIEIATPTSCARTQCRSAASCSASWRPRPPSSTAAPRPWTRPKST